MINTYLPENKLSANRSRRLLLPTPEKGEGGREREEILTLVKCGDTIFKPYEPNLSQTMNGSPYHGQHKCYHIL